MRFKRAFILILLLVFVSCGGGSSNNDNGVQTPTTPPQIVNLKIDPSVVCVGAGAEVSFTLKDASPGMITWNALLSTTVHGTLSESSGSVADGTNVQIRFKAATSGRHRHRITLTIRATDAAGRESDPVSIDLFVFNC